MPKKRSRRGFHGPWVASAVFCEKILQEKDGVFSLIRIVDRFTITVTDGQTPGLLFWAAVMLKADEAHGTFNVSIRAQTPSGESAIPPVNASLLFEGADRGVNINAQIAMPVVEEGLYWFEVRVEEQLLTKMPLRVLFQRVQIGTGSATP